MEVTYLIAFDTGLWSSEVHEVDVKPVRDTDKMHARLLRWARANLATQASYRSAVGFFVKGFDNAVSQPRACVEIPTPQDIHERVDFKCQLYLEIQRRWLDACDYGPYETAKRELQKGSMFGNRTRLRKRVMRVITIESLPAQ